MRMLGEPPEVEASVDSSEASDVVVVVEDDAPTLRALERSLGKSFTVLGFSAAEPAVERVLQGGISAILSDISLPGMSGLELLGAVREHDADLPVVLITGSPSLESATRAIEHGVYRYLPKPLDDSRLPQLLQQATQLHRLARLKRAALELNGAPSAPRSNGPDASLMKALETLSVVYQPIVSHASGDVYGYEALMRSGEPGFPSPASLLATAERTGALHLLGQRVRARALDGLRHTPPSALLFINLHPQDLLDPELRRADGPLAAQASRIVLEVTERASLDGITQLKSRLAALRELGFRIAVDDLGAGYAGLTSFALLEPEIVKLDMTLTRQIESSSVKQKLVGSFSRLCRDMGRTIVAEGVETVAERDTLTSLGCDLLQGHLFGRPGRLPAGTGG
jgi:EAL domain-containing protein (putative c-di-GMP-specific phosphodiesterase class I)